LDFVNVRTRGSPNPHSNIKLLLCSDWGHAVAQLVEALFYKPESRGFKSLRGHWIFFNRPNPFSLIMALGSTQLLTEMSTSNILGAKARPARKADNLAAIYGPIV
jgi:hypothetical protein